jgi:hypothetical protein
MTSIDHPVVSRDADKSLARLVFFSFVLTFAAARVLVLLIMTQKLPDFFLHVGGTHVHHLNYGIFMSFIKRSKNSKSNPKRPPIRGFSDFQVIKSLYERR